MQYAAGIVTAIIVGIVLNSITSGFGLMQAMVAFGLGLMAYGLVEKQMKKRGGDNEPR